MTNAPAQAPVPPQRVMAQFLFGKQLTASLSALARLGVADHMGDTAISADELAGKVGAHAPERPEQAETFQRAMSGGSAIAAQSIVGSYDFPGIERLADLGGGHGLLLASVLQKYPAMQGVLFDLPEVVAGVPGDRLDSCGGRLRVEAGSFFDRVPQGATPI